jgi:hypothetical protein
MFFFLLVPPQDQILIINFFTRAKASTLKARWDKCLLKTDMVVFSVVKPLTRPAALILKKMGNNSLLRKSRIDTQETVSTGLLLEYEVISRHRDRSHGTPWVGKVVSGIWC